MGYNLGPRSTGNSLQHKRATCKQIRATVSADVQLHIPRARNIPMLKLLIIEITVS